MKQQLPFFEKVDKIEPVENLDFSRIDVVKLHEAGFREAILGMALSFKNPSEPLLDFFKNFQNEYEEYYQKKIKTAKRLAFMDGGHNKFLESIVCWVYFKLPRYIWSEFDTYRVGMTKNSESTVHTLLKYNVNENDFINILQLGEISEINKRIDESNSLSEAKSILPEGFLQGRM